MRVFVTRHGESVANFQKCITGVTDVALTEQGREQARDLAKRAANLGIDIILTSPLIRAKLTADIVGEALCVPVVVDPRLTEQSFGVFEGGPRDNPAFLAMRDSFTHKIPQGESLLRVAQRVFNVLDEIKSRYEGKTVLIVSHSAIVKVIHAYFCDISDEEYRTFRFGNCELKEYDPGKA
jgi:probable phosphoglycerate mutase